MHPSPPNPSGTLDPAMLARLRDEYDAQREAGNPNRTTPFSDHAITEEEWDTANAVACHVAADLGYDAEEAGITWLRQRVIGALAFAEFCDTHYSPDDWEWPSDPRTETPEITSVREAYALTRFRVGDALVAVSATPSLDEQANPLYVYWMAEGAAADHQVGAVIDTDENNVTLYGATPREDIRDLRNRVAHPGSHRDEVYEMLRERRTTLANDERLPEHVDLTELPSEPVPENPYPPLGSVDGGE